MLRGSGRTGTVLVSQIVARPARPVYNENGIASHGTCGAIISPTRGLIWHVHSSFMEEQRISHSTG